MGRLSLSLAFIGCLAAAATAGQLVFSEDFEHGPGNWYPDHGVWQVGDPLPSSGPGGGHNSPGCAGTILDGYYPHSSNTTHISPSISLPAIAGTDRLTLLAWQWFTTQDCCDYGEITVSQNGGPFEPITHTPIAGDSKVWTQIVLDLSSYANSVINLGFHFVSDGCCANDWGWYVDDVTIEKGPVIFRNPDDFELGVGYWSADNGVWQVGTPAGGPTPYSGSMCAGTILGGFYPHAANSRLISDPIPITTSGGATPELVFQQWYSTQLNADLCWVQVSKDGVTWDTVAGPFSGSSPVWTPFHVLLGAYVGSTIRIGFYFQSDGCCANDWGWYLDDVVIRNICQTRFTSLGPGTPGSGGCTPLLSGVDGFCQGSFLVDITQALGRAACLLFFSGGQINAPFFCGRFYVDLTGGFGTAWLLLGGSPGAPCAGSIELPGVDVTVFQGMSVFMQGIVLDPGGCSGVAMTNGLELTIQ